MDIKERREAIKYIKAQLEDGYIDLWLHDQNELKIIEEAMSALIALPQFKWERDVALEQLEELGIGFAEEIDGKYLTKEEYEELLEYKYMYEDLCR